MITAATLIPIVKRVSRALGTVDYNYSGEPGLVGKVKKHARRVEAAKAISVAITLNDCYRHKALDAKTSEVM